MSVKEAETKISLLEREKRRANRRTVIIADSHRKALDFDRLADFLGDLKVETAYTSRECSKARFPGRSQEKVIPQVMQNYPDTTNMIVQLCCNDLSNMRDLSDVKLMFKMAKDSTINTVEICEKAVLENKNLSILIIPRTPGLSSSFSSHTVCQRSCFPSNCWKKSSRCYQGRFVGVSQNHIQQRNHQPIWITIWYESRLSPFNLVYQGHLI